MLGCSQFLQSFAVGHFFWESSPQEAWLALPLKHQQKSFGTRVERTAFIVTKDSGYCPGGSLMLWRWKEVPWEGCRSCHSQFGRRVEGVGWTLREWKDSMCVQWSLYLSKTMIDFTFILNAAFFKLDPCLINLKKKYWVVIYSERNER